MRKPVLTILGLIFTISVIWSGWYMIHQTNSGKDKIKTTIPEKDRDPTESAAVKHEPGHLRDRGHHSEKKTKQDSTVKKNTLGLKEEISKKERENLWDIKIPEILPGSILPDHRIVAYYGNLYSKKMGVLGEYPPGTMLEKLKQTAKAWQTADPTKKVIPALQLITVSGQGSPGKDGKYRLRMPFSMVDSVLNMADRIHALVILDFQVGKSTVEMEIPRYEKYLQMPNVELAVDPEFSMKTDNAPGTRIGTLSAADINFCVNYLKDLVDKYHLPPKVLIVHRFTQDMVTGYRDIHLCSQVQIVMDMDGWGHQALKKNTYFRYIYSQPIEYTGFKLFYKNDTKKGGKLMTPEEVLQLYPQPVYIQYQ